MVEVQRPGRDSWWRKAEPGERPHGRVVLVGAEGQGLVCVSRKPHNPLPLTA